jgi:translation elongation factor EF-4
MMIVTATLIPAGVSRCVRRSEVRKLSYMRNLTYGEQKEGKTKMRRVGIPQETFVAVLNVVVEVGRLPG